MTALEFGIQLLKATRNTVFQDENLYVVEAGVYKGHTLCTIAKAFQGDKTISVHGFDSFEGLPHDWENTVCKKGHFSLDGVIPPEPIELGANIWPGWFDKTMRMFMNDTPFRPIGLLHLDCDLYTSTATTLSELNQRIETGTVIVCDEWTFNFEERLDNEEQKAVWDWAQMFGRKVSVLEYEDPTVDTVAKRHVGMERKVLVVTQ
jgi:hypothetical protein